mmetsp:Transcript_40726/g.47357  ORF Transcript_40726/g.47357 Transcript_40726/m.47357 type:complete len:808 (+) Transcript_40726:119-2542(+)|eukprot:CAMPEP_0176447542 /NCGR_PEP_ID=MMETSP0127-20121128/25116_1 /TAXON_ID=938130 /ORGANISM="Platyophrya macrostoma, Strain WH" /LENGTH=807 /DNA_ID=CAMNT_0017834053 /DNA_START=118 /DNA_END=2541 /DNA_ORIENTATION=+
MPPKAPPKAAGKKGPVSAIAALKARMEKQKEEEERLQREAEEEERRLREEERLAEEQRKFEEEEKRLERERQKEEQKVMKKADKQTDKNSALERMRAAGMILPDIEKVRAEQKAEAEKPKPKPAPKVAPKHVDPEPEPESESEGDEILDDWEEMVAREERREERRLRKEAAAKAKAEAEAKAREAEHVLEKVSNLRSPICCVLGHVDTGKTSLLDRIRSTNVQGGEAGGITQQIGATFFPRSALVDATAEVNKKYQYDLDVPGLLVIDTPGHESFTNLRSRGSSLCDIAVLVVDIMHGLEQQTKESIRLLREKRCPFIVALNKVDRLYGWEVHENMDIEQTLSLQKPYVRSEFDTRVGNILTEFAEQGLNAELYYKNKDVKRFVSIVPTSAKTGEGVCDLLLLQIQLVQQFMEGKVTYKDDLQCTVLEVKPIQGHGFTIDVVLINGILHEGDNICVCGANGPIFTQIRSLLTPQPMREMRVRGDYIHHKEIRAAMGIKIAANDLEYAIPGTPLLLVRDGDDKEAIARDVMKDATNLLQDVDKSGVGVTVQSSTLGSLEALLSFLKDMKIPVANVAIGPMHKRHMLQVVSMKRKAPRYAVVLAFDTVVTPEAQELADQNDIEIFEARIIYHLFDMFTKYHNEYEEREKAKARSIAIFPVQLKVLQAVRNADPIILGVSVVRGQLHPGTPLAFINKENRPTLIGKVESIQRDEKEVKIGKPGMDVAVKINSSDTTVVFGRHFDESNTVLSLLTRASVDAVKMFKDELSQDDVNLMATLMKVLDIRKKAPAAPAAGAAGAAGATANEDEE